MEKEKKDKEHIGETLKKLQKIVEWFDAQDDLDLELALQKVREGAKLVASGKARLAAIENEFNEVKQSLADER
jgi:exonuclease VII small subunit